MIKETYGWTECKTPKNADNIRIKKIQKQSIGKIIKQLKKVQNTDKDGSKNNWLRDTGGFLNSKNNDGFRKKKTIKIRGKRMAFALKTISE